MKSEKYLFALFIAAAVLFMVFYFYSLFHVSQTCDGHVVKNIFDWPVCVH